MSVEPVREPDPWGADDDYYRKNVQDEHWSFMVYYAARDAVLKSWNDSPDSVGLSLLERYDLSVLSHRLHPDGSWKAVVSLWKKDTLMWHVTHNILTGHTTVTSYKKTSEIVLNNDQEKEN